MKAAGDPAESISIVASSHDAIVGMAASGVITSCNPAAAAMYGAGASEIIGQPAEIFVPPWCRGEEATVLHRILDGDVVEQYRTERLHRDGSVAQVWASVSPILDAGGVVVGVATVSRQVGALQKASDRFEIRVDQQRVEARDATERLVLRADQHRVEAHDAADRYADQIVLERERAEDAADRFEAAADLPSRIRQHQVDVDEASARLQRRAEQHRTEVYDESIRFEGRVDLEREQAQDATDRFEVQVLLERAHVQQALKQSEGEYAEARRDRENMEAQLQQSQRLEVLGQLAGGVAHDFNNLIAVILNYATFVGEELDIGPTGDLVTACRDVGQIRRAAERASALTHQLLAFARREAVRQQVLDLNRVVAEVRQLLDRSIGEHVVLRTDLADGLWPVMADEGQIEQLLVNLAVNARDAMHGGGVLSIDTANVTVGPETGSRLLAGRHVRLRVGDTGTGMSADVVAHVFEPFFTTKPDGIGTGLGLATVYGIVAQLEATIEIETSPGSGTTFTITIPVTHEVAAQSEDGLAHHPVPAGETILIVEDEEALREVTERILVRSGYRVIAAADGAAALAAAAEYDGEIHLLLTDVIMPHMLGTQVAEKLLFLKPDTEVLYMSGYAQPVLTSRGALSRDAHLIEKPFSSAKLIAQVAHLINGHPH